MGATAMFRRGGRGIRVARGKEKSKQQLLWRTLTTTSIPSTLTSIPYAKHESGRSMLRDYFEVETEQVAFL